MKRNKRMTAELIKYAKNQLWIEDLVQGIPPEMDEEVEKWVRTRPEVIKALLIKFPPDCLVVAKQPLKCPAPGMVGIVASYLEPKDKSLPALVSVLDDAKSPTMRAQCHPEWLEVVGFTAGHDHEWVERILKDH